MYCYKLLRSIDGSSNFQHITDVVHPGNKMVDRNNITPGKLYSYTLAAIDSAGNQSEFSDTVSVGIPAVLISQKNLDDGQSSNLPLAEVFGDPDNNLSELQVSFSSASHVQVSISGNDLVVTPEPLNYTGTAQITIKVQDPIGFWDEKVVSFHFGTTSGQYTNDIKPEEFAVFQNYPNPFNPTTEIKYNIPQSQFVQVVVYNALGQKVKTLISGYQQAGSYNLIWQGTNDAGQKVGSGTYIFTVRAGEHFETRKMILQK